MSFLVTSSVARQLVPAQSSRYLAAVTSPGACVNTENSPIQTTTNMLIKCSILIWSFLSYIAFLPQILDNTVKVDQLSNGYIIFRKSDWTVADCHLAADLSVSVSLPA